MPVKSWLVFRVSDDLGLRLIEVEDSQLLIQYDQNGAESVIELNATQKAYVSSAWSEKRLVFRSGTGIYSTPQRPSDFHEWDPVANVWVLTDIVVARDLKWQEIKTARDTQEFGFFTWSTYEFDGDEFSQKRIADAAVEAFMAQVNSISWSTDWTLADNSVITLDEADMVAVFAAMRANIKSAHDTARDLKADIDAATTVAAVEAITWP